MILSIKPRVFAVPEAISKTPEAKQESFAPSATIIEKEKKMPNGNEKEAQQKSNVAQNTPPKQAGFNYMPLLLLAGLAVGLYFLMKSKGAKIPDAI